MGVPLDTWQEQMEGHFSDLKTRRDRTGFPIFALEHGLSTGNLEDIAGNLRQNLIQGERIAPHWLLWTIYAAEMGYSYEGGEYWQSFEDETPGWDSRDRYKISRCFRKFQDSYNGVAPSGPWAKHFSIIAWPITHAVLPRFLQWQFARTLYDLRHRLARLSEVDPGTIGRLIASNAYHASTRLEQFLQQEELVGRIVLALLHQDQVEGEKPLLPATLDRIVSDLEQAGDARAWIKEASRVVSDRFKGLGRGTDSRNTIAKGGATQSAPLDVRPIIRPDLRLQYKGKGSWDLQVDIPSFRDVGALNSEVRQFLKQTRCTVNGSPGKKPRGWLLSGRRQAVLRDWPDTDKPMVAFEASNGTVDHLLSSECRVSPGPVWLFRIGKDGLAREIAGRTVRPAHDYVIVSREPLDFPFPVEQNCTINCAGIHAIHLSIPEAIPEGLAQKLSAWKLEVARTIRVWPVGLPGRRWDGEGRGEWLTTERPCLGIAPDHKVESFEISLDGMQAQIIQASEPGQPSFIQLPELTSGTHFLKVSAQTKNKEGAGIASHEGFLEISVREPEPWVSGTALHAGLIVTRNPYDATLDEFWQNEFDLSVAGPEGRQVTPYVSLHNAAEDEIFRQQVCDAINLPITADVWKKRFKDFIQREKCEWRYLEAASGILTLDGGELGNCEVRFENEVKPVRWVLRHWDDGVFIRLVDETNQEEIAPVCRFFEMELPRKGRRVNAEKALRGFKVEPPGGLFAAQIGKSRDYVIVSTGLSGSQLAGLGVQPSHGSISSDPKEIVKLLRVLRYWKNARVAGDLGNAHRYQVINTLMQGIVGIVAGFDWARAEARLVGAREPHEALSRLRSLVNHKSGMASVIIRDASTQTEGRKQLIAWFSNLAKRYQIAANDDSCQFAMEFAGRPHSLPTLYPTGLENHIRDAKTSQTLVRAARLAILCNSLADGGAGRLLRETES
ncbi:hypothetical protein [Hoeflea phototrophica]|nr:hypothetical protein [Hoeflea phototrophica]